MTDIPYDVEAVTRNVYLKMINESVELRNQKKIN